MGYPDAAVRQNPFMTFRNCRVMVAGEKGDGHALLKKIAPQFVFESAARGVACFEGISIQDELGGAIQQRLQRIE